MSELKEITALLLSNIEDKITSKTIFNLWFENLELVSLSDEKAVFMTTTKLRKNIISTKYMDILENTLEEIIGFRVKVELDYPEKENETVITASDFSTEPDDTENLRRESEKRKREINYFLGDEGNPPNKSLLQEYTFENFIEGESNKFVKAACLAVAKDLTYYNPLFIHSPSGLGKTHLLYAVINNLRQNHP